MKNFPSSISIIEKFIQSPKLIEIMMDNDECTTLEDLVYEVGSWRTDILEDYGSVAHYILMSLDKEYN
jgi:hypothetical protein